VVLIQ